MTKYRLDKTIGKAQTIQEADNNRTYWMNKDIEERLSAAWYLITSIYGFTPENSPGLDKSIFGMRKHAY